MSSRPMVTTVARDLSQAVRSELSRQRAFIKRPLLVAAGVSAAGVGLVLATAKLAALPVDDLVRDTFAVAGVPIYIGLLSNMGIMAWAAAATLWLFGWGLLRQLAPAHYLRRFMLASGLLTLTLLVDDAFMLHELVLPEVLGIPERVVLLGYVAAGLLYIVAGWEGFLKTNFLPGLVAGLLLGASLGIDFVANFGPIESLVEDSLKFAGIIFWLVYTQTVVAQVVAEQRVTGQPESWRAETQRPTP
jgi:hypothetical protein